MVVVIVFIILIVAIPILFYLLIFKRDPKRIIPKGNSIVSPADGKIIQIIKTKDLDKIQINKGLVGKIKTLCNDVAKECTIISIMMTPLNVHYQRAPIDGKVIYTKHSSGTFINAVTNRSLKTLENEKNEILIQKDKLKLKVIQIAGFAARRIKCFVNKAEKIEKGQKIGFIDLGSQVSVILPKHLPIKVKAGQKVVGGETIIAHEKTQ